MGLIVFFWNNFMNIKKLLTMGSLAVLLSANLSGCMTHTIISSAESKQGYEFNIHSSDSLIGFVINQDGKLIMLGKNYVYVFDDNENTKKLKEILITPEFLTLKQMSWTTVSNGQAQQISYYVKNQSFEFDVEFDFMYKNEREFVFLNELGFHNIDTKSTSWNEKLYNGYGEIKSFKHYIGLSGKVYQHNTSTQALINNAKPLSKPYTFALLNSKPKRTLNSKSAGMLLLLPFAVAGDLLTLPISYGLYKIGKNWH